MRDASVERLARVEGVSAADAQRIYAFFAALSESDDAETAPTAEHPDS